MLEFGGWRLWCIAIDQSVRRERCNDEKKEPRFFVSFFLLPSKLWSGRQRTCRWAINARSIFFCPSFLPSWLGEDVFSRSTRSRPSCHGFGNERWPRMYRRLAVPLRLVISSLAGLVDVIRRTGLVSFFRLFFRTLVSFTRFLFLGSPFVSSPSPARRWPQSWNGYVELDSISLFNEIKLTPNQTSKYRDNNDSYAFFSARRTTWRMNKLSSFLWGKK